MLVFSTQLCELLHSNLLSGSALPPLPLPCVNKYAVYTYTVCKGRGVLGSRPQTDKHLPPSPFTGQFFQMATFSMSLIFLRGHVFVSNIDSRECYIYIYQILEKHPTCDLAKKDNTQKVRDQQIWF
jgi:hypothetical protein